MTNEAFCLETPTEFRRYTIADATAVPIGSIMKLSTPNTCALSTADNDVFAGIAWEEKSLSDGITEITCAVNGIWDLKLTAVTIVAGKLVNIGGADNVVSEVLAADLLTGSLVGKALEGGNGDVIRVAVGRSI